MRSFRKVITASLFLLVMVPMYANAENFRPKYDKGILSDEFDQTGQKLIDQFVDYAEFMGVDQTDITNAMWSGRFTPSSHQVVKVYEQVALETLRELGATVKLDVALQNQGNIKELARIFSMDASDDYIKIKQEIQRRYQLGWIEKFGPVPDSFVEYLRSIGKLGSAAEDLKKNTALPVMIVFGMGGSPEIWQEYIRIREKIYQPFLKDRMAKAGLTVEATGPSKPEMPSKAERIKETIKKLESTASRSGHVFRAPARWANYNHHQNMRYIFDGTGKAIDAESHLFGIMFKAYVFSYSKLCEEHLPRESTVYKMVRNTQVKNGYNNVVSEYSEVVGRTVVHPNLVSLYDHYRLKDNTAREVSIVKELISSKIEDLGKLFNKHTGLYVNSVDDMTRFLQREGCIGPAKIQFETNLVRHATGQPSLQKAGEPVEGAANSSDTGSKLFAAQTIAEACVINYNYLYELYGYCKCLGKEAGPRLSKSDVIDIVSNYTPAKVDFVRNLCTN